jgi:hypothetical protein
MKVLAIIVGLSLIVMVLRDAFDSIVLPRRVARRFRFTRFFYRTTWRPWNWVAKLLSARRREAFLSYFGPLSLLMLLVLWAIGLVVGFGLIEWVAGISGAAREPIRLMHALYYSGTTLFTLGLGDVVPLTHFGKFITVAESGTGLGFLALVIGYGPVIYQSFSRREVAVSLLDARAGSPPSAGELLRRHADSHGQQALYELLREWERWSAELLESHISYPIIAYYRSQHSNQSWIAALAAILDTCAIVRVGFEGPCERQAELTFAIARHAVVDLSQVFSVPPRRPAADRLPPERFGALVRHLEAAGLHLRETETAEQRLAELRRLYEPYISSLAAYFRLPLPPWTPESHRSDNWQTSAWKESAARCKAIASRGSGEDDGHL